MLTGHIYAAQPLDGRRTSRAVGDGRAAGDGSWTPSPCHRRGPCARIVRTVSRANGASSTLVLLSGARHAFAPDRPALGRSMADFTAVPLERAREAERSRTLAARLELAPTSHVVAVQLELTLTNRLVTEVVEGHPDPGPAGPAL